MEDTPEPSPFAAFAAPRRGAAELFQERQRKAAHARRLMIGCVCACAVGAACGSSVGAADGNFEAAWPALAGASAGALLGVVAGFILGGICFAVLIVMNARGKPGLDAELGRRDPLAGMQAMFFVWSLIGVAIGAAAGALLGVQTADPALKTQPLLRSVMIASILGEAFAAGLWGARLRVAVKPAAGSGPSQSI
jgi:hypothetical protein